MKFPIFTAGALMMLVSGPGCHGAELRAELRDESRLNGVALVSALAGHVTVIPFDGLKSTSIPATASRSQRLERLAKWFSGGFGHHFWTIVASM